jgi:hypothetical protein
MEYCSLGSSCQYKRFLSCLGLLWSAKYKIFFPSPYTLFNLCVPIAQQPGQAVVQGRLSLNVYSISDWEWDSTESESSHSFLKKQDTDPDFSKPELFYCRETNFYFFLLIRRQRMNDFQVLEEVKPQREHPYYDFSAFLDSH